MCGYCVDRRFLSANLHTILYINSINNHQKKRIYMFLAYFYTTNLYELTYIRLQIAREL